MDTQAAASTTSSMRVLAHPLRLRLLSLLTGSAMSAAEAARHLGQSQANVSYHLRRLHEAGLVELVEEERIRGGWAKRYRHDPDSGSTLRARDLEEQQVLLQVVAAELRRRSAARTPRAAGAFTDAELWVSPYVYQQALAAARHVGHLLHDSAQAPRTPGTVRVSATVSLFLMQPDHPAPSLPDDLVSPVAPGGETGEQ